MVEGDAVDLSHRDNKGGLRISRVHPKLVLREFQRAHGRALKGLIRALKGP